MLFYVDNYLQTKLHDTPGGEEGADPTLGNAA
jgi:hypothetical protein